MRPLIGLLVMLLASCERGPEAPTAEQNVQLDEMDNLLDDEANRSANRP